VARHAEFGWHQVASVGGAEAFHDSIGASGWNTPDLPPIH